MKPRERKFILALAMVTAIASIVTGGYLGMDRYRRWREERRVHVSREGLESKSPIVLPPVLVLQGTVDDHKFEITMRGFTNYFRKETWGETKEQRNMLGGRKSGGYLVEIRTPTFSGNWQMGWQGSHGGGGGGGSESYTDDMLPGRFLWSSRGFVGAQSNYEYHDKWSSTHQQTTRIDEEYENCVLEMGALIPRRILWGKAARDYKGWHENELKVYKIQSVKFQEGPDEAWFSERVKEYFPPQAISKVTNSIPEAVTGNITNK